MAQDNSQNFAPWAVTLSPHRSLGQPGFLAVMAILAGISFVAGIVFMSMGAWPVSGFFGLDVALVWWAFRANFKDGGARERIEISGDRVVLQRGAAGRLDEEVLFNRRWVKIRLDHDEARELTGKLCLVSHGKATEIASFLGQDEKRMLAAELRAALASPRI
jgi:uncharacterized membrane protein